MEKEPSILIANEALLVSCVVGALPSALMSLGERSWVPLFSFLVVAYLHGFLLGLPAFWILVWQKAVNAFTCITAGLLVATLPYAIFFAPRMSGPGVNHARTLMQFALSGAAIGFVFWVYVTKRTRKVGEQVSRPGAPATPQFLDPHFAERFANNEMFEWLRRGTGGHAYLSEALKLARPDFESRGVRDLSITISADSSGPDRYLISVRNSGSRTFEELRVHHEPVLLDAESFGLDTTHMPSEQASIAGEPVLVDILPPGQTAAVVRSGYGPHERYDGPQETVFDVEYRSGGKSFTRENRHWCHVRVAMAKARSD
jgi:hypothetical protein